MKAVVNVQCRPFENAVQSKPRVFLFGCGGASRWSRKERAAVVEQLKVEVEGFANAQFNWSRKAGCACGCSPGFVVSGSDRRENLFVDVEEVSVN